MNGRDVRIGASLLAGDMDRMVRFYRDTLGFHTDWNGGDFAEFETAGYQSWAYDFPLENLSPILSASVTFMLPTRKVICLKSAVRMKRNKK